MDCAPRRLRDRLASRHCPDGRLQRYVVRLHGAHRGGCRRCAGAGDAFSYAVANAEDAVAVAATALADALADVLADALADPSAADPTDSSAYAILVLVFGLDAYAVADAKAGRSVIFVVLDRGNAAGSPCLRRQRRRGIWDRRDAEQCKVAGYGIPPGGVAGLTYDSNNLVVSHGFLQQSTDGSIRLLCAGAVGCTRSHGLQLCNFFFFCM